MRRMFAVLVFTGGALLGSVLATMANEGPPSNPWRVLVVQSYNPEYIWTANIDQGIREALKDLSVEFEFHYLDAKRRPEPSRIATECATLARHMQAWNPDMVIAGDDAAQASFVVPYCKDKARPQVIFCGVNARPEEYGYPAANVSGVLEKFHFRQSFALMKEIMPTARSVAYLSDDSAPGGFLVRDLRDEETLGPFALNLAGVETVHTFEQWKAAVLKYQDKTDVLALGIYHSLRSGTGNSTVPVEQVVAWTNSVLRKPTLGFADFAPDHGILCGVLESGGEQGFVAGSMAKEVLLSQRLAGQLPIRTNMEGMVMLNLRTAEHLGLVIPFEIIEAAGVVVRE